MQRQWKITLVIVTIATYITSLSLYIGPAAIISFEDRGVVNPVAEIFDSSRKKLVVNSKNCLFFLNIHIFTLYTYILS